MKTKLGTEVKLTRGVANGYYIEVNDVPVAELLLYDDDKLVELLTRNARKVILHGALDQTLKLEIKDPDEIQADITSNDRVAAEAWMRTDDGQEV